MRLFTVTETMRYLKLSRTTIDRLSRAGQITPVRIGSRVLFKKEDLDLLIRNSKEVSEDSLSKPRNHART